MKHYIINKNLLRPMFKTNTDHQQSNLFDLFSYYPASLNKQMKQSEEYCFYQLIFSKIKEKTFSVLFSNKKSRPNAPINVLVSALILMQRFQWTYEELFKQIKFNILTKIALGLKKLDDIPFCPATIYNFQNRLNKHFVETGENLLEQVFDELTSDQLKRLKIKANIQRTDSFAAASNIRNYSRLQLLVELIIRMYRVLSEKDKQRFADRFTDYIKRTSGQYIYKMKASDIPHQIEQIGQLYYWIDQNLKSLYSEHTIFKTFERVYVEHFTEVKDKTTVKKPEELTSDCVQSPDDLDATYRNKNGQSSKGQSINIVETANPDNPINLITDMAVNPVNKDDSKVLNDRLDNIIEKTPDLNEIHFDGAFGSTENDHKFEEHEITPVQTAIRGKVAEIDLDIDQQSDTEYTVKCPNQEVKSEPTRTRYKAEFDITICNNCDCSKKCPAIVMKNSRVYYFTHDDYLSKKRQKTITTLPPERRKLRCNVEATVNEFTCRLPKGKLKVRGAFKTGIFAYSMAISINFGRIYRYSSDKIEVLTRLFYDFDQIFKEQLQYVVTFLSNAINIIKKCKIYKNIAFSKTCF